MVSFIFLLDSLNLSAFEKEVCEEAGGSLHCYLPKEGVDNS